MANSTLKSSVLQQIVQGTCRHYLQGFLIERRSRGLAQGTIEYYQGELSLFMGFLDSQGVVMAEEVTPDLVRTFLLTLGEKRSPGGVHATFRAIRAFFGWIEAEFEEIRSPVRKVPGPKVNKQPREGVSVETIRALIHSCDTEMARRDKLILLVLFDTGVRASELLAIDVEDVDLVLGSIDIRHGKGNKRRTVFVGKKTRRELRAYLKENGLQEGALFRTDEGERMQYQGLVKVITRRAEAAGAPAPGVHDFRRAFAVTMLRNHVDVIQLAEMMGHTTLEMTRRYVKLVDDDLRLAHSQAGPVDKSL